MSKKHELYKNLIKVVNYKGWCRNKTFQCLPYYITFILNQVKV